MKSTTVKSICLFLFGILCIQSSLFSQETIKGIPDDLNVSKIIFLRLDSASVMEGKIDDRRERFKNKIRIAHNENVPISNQQLVEISADYPFEYVIAYRSEIEKYKEQGYHYVLDYAPFENLRKGERSSSASTIVEWPFYIEDLSSGDIYVVDKVSETFTYAYKALIKKTLLKEVKKKFKDELK